MHNVCLHIGPLSIGAQPLFHKSTFPVGNSFNVNVDVVQSGDVEGGCIHVVFDEHQIDKDAQDSGDATKMLRRC